MPTPPVVETMFPAPAGPERAAVRRKRWSENVAVMLAPPAATVTVHDPPPLHGAPHCTVEPAVGVACSVICVPGVTAAEQVAPQLRLPPPDHEAVTMPEPFPSFTIAKFASSCTKVAVTCVAACTFVSVHMAPLAVEQPDHCLRCQPWAALARRVRLAPTLTVTGHEAFRQLTLVPVTVPWPLRWIETVTV
jgi:hypothetical protein